MGGDVMVDGVEGGEGSGREWWRWRKRGRKGEVCGVRGMVKG